MTEGERIAAKVPIGDDWREQLAKIIDDAIRDSNEELMLSINEKHLAQFIEDLIMAGGAKLNPLMIVVGVKEYIVQHQKALARHGEKTQEKI